MPRLRQPHSRSGQAGLELAKGEIGALKFISDEIETFVRVGPVGRNVAHRKNDACVFVLHTRLPADAERRSSRGPIDRMRMAQISKAAPVISAGVGAAPMDMNEIT